MTEPALTYLAPWSAFFTMTAASAATLTGLMFVVLTLVSGSNRTQAAKDGVSTFSTPTVIHFGAALLISAILCAPFRSLGVPATAIAIAAFAGVVHMLRVAFLSRRLTRYSPDVEDWIWYTVLPLIAYCTIFAAAMAMFSAPVNALFVLAAGLLFLIFMGIRNAWDIVTYVAVYGLGSEPPSGSGTR